MIHGVQVIGGRVRCSRCSLHVRGVVWGPEMKKTWDSLCLGEVEVLRGRVRFRAGQQRAGESVESLIGR